MQDLLQTTITPFNDKKITIPIDSSFGIRRSVLVTSTDLAIPNRARSKTLLEDGLLPVSLHERSRILDLATNKCSEEFSLMLELGFGTGMRLGSITDLKICTLMQAQPDANSNLLHRLQIGPGIKHCPVHTKFGITGSVIITHELLDRLQQYVNSPRRLRREALANPSDKRLVFLNRFGKPYSRHGQDRSPTVNVEMTRFKKHARDVGLNLDDFKFHRARATFATSIAETAIKSGGATVVGNVVSLIRELLLHKNERTSLQYIRFVQDQDVKMRWANEFTKLFVGDNLADLSVRTKNMPDHEI